MANKLTEAALSYREKATAYDEARQHRLLKEQELDAARRANQAACDDFYAAREALADAALQEFS